MCPAGGFVDGAMAPASWSFSSPSFLRSGGFAGEVVEVVWFLGLLVVAVVASKLWFLVLGLLPRFDVVGSDVVDEVSGWMYRSSSSARRMLSSFSVPPAGRGGEGRRWWWWAIRFCCLWCRW